MCSPYFPSSPVLNKGFPRLSLTLNKQPLREGPHHKPWLSLWAGTASLSPFSGTPHTAQSHRKRLLFKQRAHGAVESVLWHEVGRSRRESQPGPPTTNNMNRGKSLTQLELGFSSFIWENSPHGFRIEQSREWANVSLHRIKCELYQTLFDLGLVI